MNKWNELSVKLLFAEINLKVASTTDITKYYITVEFFCSFAVPLELTLCSFQFVSDRMEIINDTADMDEPIEARPIQIVTTQDDHTFVLDEDTLTEVLLQDHIKDRFVVVISVAGAFRKGKSFLLDFFLRYLYARVIYFSSFFFQFFSMHQPMEQLKLFYLIFVEFIEIVREKRRHRLDWKGRWTVARILLARWLGAWYNRNSDVVRYLHMGLQKWW